MTSKINSYIIKRLKKFFFSSKNYIRTALKNYKEKEDNLKQKLFSQKLNKIDSINDNNKLRKDKNNSNNKTKPFIKEKSEKENESNDLDLNESSMDERINKYYKGKKDNEEFDSEIDSDNASLTSNEDENLNEESDENINSEQEEEQEQAEELESVIANKSNQNDKSKKTDKNYTNKKIIESNIHSLNKAMKKTLNEIDMEKSEDGEVSIEFEEENLNEKSEDNQVERNNGEWESVSDECSETSKENEFTNKRKIENYEGFEDEDEPSEENEGTETNNNNNNNNQNTDLKYMEQLHPAYDELDDEIKKLERKLGITKKDKYDRLKKKVASENFDEDLFDFLDDIDHYVQDKKEVKTSDSKVAAKPEQLPRNKKAAANNKSIKETKAHESQDEISEKKESLEELKSKSKLFNKAKISDEQLLKNQLNKDIIAILNRISEGNLSILVKDFLAKLDSFEIAFSKISNRKNALISIYEVTTRNCLKAIADQIITNITISSCVATYMSILHFKYGNSFMLYFIKTLIENFNTNFDLLMKEESSGNKAELKNLIFLLIQFYLYGNLSARLYYDLIKKFIENFNDISSELLLLLLNYLGIELRKEDPESLKEIFRKVNSKYNSSVAQSKLIPDNNNNNNTNNNTIGLKVLNLQPNSNKIKFVVEMIEEIKNNKFMKFNMNEKFNFFKNFVNNIKKDYTQENYNLNSEKIADKIDLGLESLKNFDKNKLQDYIEEGNETNLKLNDFVLENIDDIEIDDNIFCNNKILEQKMQKLKLTTDLKKKIFKAIVGATDFIDAYERINRLNLKKDQSREIIKIIILLVGSEKIYNQFYKLLLERLIEFEKDHRYTFHYAIWDNMRIMNTFKEQ